MPEETEAQISQSYLSGIEMKKAELITRPDIASQSYLSGIEIGSYERAKQTIVAHNRT